MTWSLWVPLLAIVLAMALFLVYQHRRIQALLDELDEVGERPVEPPGEEFERKQRILAQAEKIAHFGSWEWDITTNKLTWSEGLFRIHGVPPRTFESAEEALKFIHRDDRKRVQMEIFRAFKTCAPVEYHARIIRPDGSPRILHVKGDIVAENGRAVRMHGACQDVTELKEAEKSLARLGTIIASSDDAIFGQTVYGKINSWNKGAERIFGYKLSEAIGRSAEFLLPPGHRDSWEKILSDIRAGEQIEHYDTERIRKDGTIIDVSLSTYSVRNDDGSVVGATTILRDITEQKRAENLIRRQAVELAQANQRLLELDGMKSEFVSNVSHELRTPIAAVKGAAANMLYGFLGELSVEQRESLEIIKRNADRLSRLIENLLDLSRIESGAFRLDLKKMDLRACVRWAINGILALAREKNLEVVQELGEEPINGVFDEDRTVQIVTNLVSNAIRFARARILVRTKIESGDAVLVVEDDGPGIPEDELSMIFERFHQARTNVGHHGTGLGLSIVSEIVNAHGGRVWAENKPKADGGGARFTVLLPLTGPIAGPASESFAAVPGAHG